LRRALLVLAIGTLLPIVLILRLPTLFFASYGRSEAWGNDEGLYLLMARDFLQGHLPYTQTFDNKPPGIYVVYALSWLLLGAGPRSIYIAACISIWCGSVAMFFLVRGASGGRKDMGLVAAVAFALFMCHSGTMGANTECFFVPIVVAAFALLWPQRPHDERTFRYAQIVAAGLLLGLAVCIKYVAAFDLFAALVVIGATYPLRQRAVTCLALVVSAASPAMGVLWTYASARELEVLYDAQIRGNLARLALQDSLSTNLALVKEQFVRLFPIVELTLVSPLYLRFSPPADGALRRALWLGLIWFAIDVAGISRIGSIRQHILAQLLPPMIVCATIVLLRGIELTEARFARLRSPALLATALALVCIGVLAAPVRFLAATVPGIARGSEDDHASVRAGYLREHVRPNDYVLLVDPWSGMEHVLSGTRSPSKYGGFSEFFTDKEMNVIAGIRRDTALTSAFEHEPKMVVIDPDVYDDSSFVRALESDMSGKYSGPSQYDGAYVYLRDGSDS
jgi:hypothetical protein